MISILLNFDEDQNNLPLFTFDSSSRKRKSVDGIATPSVANMRNFVNKMIISQHK